MTCGSSKQAKQNPDLFWFNTPSGAARKAALQTIEQLNWTNLIAIYKS